MSPEQRIKAIEARLAKKLPQHRSAADSDVQWLLDQYKAIKGLTSKREWGTDVAQCNHIVRDRNGKCLGCGEAK